MEQSIMVDQESVRPLAKSAAATAKDAPAPGYEIVAHAITGDDPPAWLVIFLKMWGPCLAVDRGVREQRLKETTPPIDRVPNGQFALPASAIAARSQQRQLLRQDPAPAQPTAHILLP
jgi:hypothetical protein